MPSMFDYGRNKSGGTYVYQFLTQNLQAGYYPVDNFKEIKHYDAPQMSSLGLPVWGEISYSKPLTPDQCNLYEFVEKPSQDLIQPDMPSDKQAHEPQADASEPDKVPGSVVLHDIKPNRVFDSKNKAYKLISMRYPDSDTGYCNYAVPAEQVSKNQDGTYDMVVGVEGQMRNISIMKNGKSEVVPMTAEDIAELYQSTLAQNSKLAFLSSVDKKFIQDTKNPNYKVVSVPYSGSENRYAKITVPAANIVESNVSGRVNVNVGLEMGKVAVSIKKDGAFVRQTMPTTELVQLQKDAVSAWQKKFNQNAQEIADKQVQPEGEAAFE